MARFIVKAIADVKPGELVCPFGVEDAARGACEWFNEGSVEPHEFCWMTEPHLERRHYAYAVVDTMGLEPTTLVGPS